MRIIIIAYSLLLSIAVSAQSIVTRYDVNRDGAVNIADVTTLVNVILGSQTSDLGDVNGDTRVDVVDVTELVNYILGKRVINGHEYADLGLPSGTLWATQNMGANAPDEYGDYYAWGEVEPKSSFWWSNYMHCDGTDKTLNRYNTDSNYGLVDNIRSLEEEDDVAHIKWGGSWHIPSLEQVTELKSKCTWELDVANNTYKVVGPNGNYIIIPTTGYIKGTSHLRQGSAGYYWTSTLGDGRPYNAECMLWEQSSFGMAFLRNCGLTIRPVAK